MTFHLGFELPKQESRELNHAVSFLTREEVRIIKRQIRGNSLLIDQFIGRLELFVNQERYPSNAVFVQKIRRRLELLMEENDTFRKVLWKHFQSEDLTAAHPA